MFSDTIRYAFRALTVLVGAEQGTFMLTQDIAREADLPSHYLSKILKSLVTGGILTSQKGIGGGYRIACDIHKTTLYDVVMLFASRPNEIKHNTCILAFEACSERGSCVLHDKWSKVWQAYDRFLRETTLAELVATGK